MLALRLFLLALLLIPRSVFAGTPVQIDDPSTGEVVADKYTGRDGNAQSPAVANVITLKDNYDGTVTVPVAEADKFKIADVNNASGTKDWRFLFGATSKIVSQLCDATDGCTLSFKTISTPSGTSPVADSVTDTLTLSAGGIVTITGDSGTDTITISATEVDGSTTNEIQNIFQTFDTPSGTDPVADTSTDTLQFLTGNSITITGNSTNDSVTVGVTDNSITPTQLDETADYTFTSTSDIVFNGTAQMPHGTSLPGSCLSGQFFVDETGWPTQALKVCDDGGAWVTFTWFDSLIEPAEMPSIIVLEPNQVIRPGTNGSLFELAKTTSGTFPSSSNTGGIALYTTTDEVVFRATGGGTPLVKLLDDTHAQTVAGVKTFSSAPVFSAGYTNNGTGTYSSTAPQITLTDTTSGDDDWFILVDADNLTIQNNTASSTGDLLVKNQAGSTLASIDQVGGFEAAAVDQTVPTGGIRGFLIDNTYTVDTIADVISGVNVGPTLNYTADPLLSETQSAINPVYNITSVASVVGSYVYQATPTYKATDAGGTNNRTFSGTNSAGYYASIITSRTGDDTVTITEFSDFLAAGGTIGAGTTVTLLNGFRYTEPTNSGTLTTQKAVVIPFLSAATNNFGLSNASVTEYPCTTAQTVATGGTITPNCTVKNITSTGTANLNASPSISDGGSNIQWIIVVNVGTNQITISDNTNVQTNGPGTTQTLDSGEMIQLLWIPSLGDWYQISGVSNNA